VSAGSVHARITAPAHGQLPIVFAESFADTFALQHDPFRGSSMCPAAGVLTLAKLNALAYDRNNYRQYSQSLEMEYDSTIAERVIQVFALFCLFLSALLDACVR
jgi:hypothetical protein